MSDATLADFKCIKTILKNKNKNKNKTFFKNKNINKRYFLRI